MKRLRKLLRVVRKIDCEGGASKIQLIEVIKRDDDASVESWDSHSGTNVKKNYNIDPVIVEASGVTLSPHISQQLKSEKASFPLTETFNRKVPLIKPSCECVISSRLLLSVCVVCHWLVWWLNVISAEKRVDCDCLIQKFARLIQKLARFN